jgi:flagellar basal-body rod protein FlgF
MAQQRNVETIANNVANANTPGFKKDQLVFKEHLTALEKGIQDIDLPTKEWAPEDFYRSYGAENAHVSVDGSYTIHEQGQLVPTGNPLDVALNGKGFFEVLTPNGVRYSRRGIFSMGQDGSLVTDQGNKLLNKLDRSFLETNRDPASEEAIPQPSERGLKIDPSKGKVAINMQGEIFQAGKKVGDISIVEFKDIHALKKEGNSLFINNHPQNVNLSNIKTIVNQGFVEQSNVNAVQEMSALIKANRNFESIQRAIKAYDSMAGKAANEIARF